MKHRLIIQKIFFRKWPSICLLCSFPPFGLTQFYWPSLAHMDHFLHGFLGTSNVPSDATYAISEAKARLLCNRFFLWVSASRRTLKESQCWWFFFCSFWPWNEDPGSIWKFFRDFTLQSTGKDGAWCSSLQPQYDQISLAPWFCSLGSSRPQNLPIYLWFRDLATICQAELELSRIIILHIHSQYLLQWRFCYWGCSFLGTSKRRGVRQYCNRLCGFLLVFLRSAKGSELSNQQRYDEEEKGKVWYWEDWCALSFCSLSFWVCRLMFWLLCDCLHRCQTLSCASFLAS